MTAIPTWEQLDAMVEGDPLLLRDVAWQLARALDEAADKLAELALVHRRYMVGGVGFCADYKGHNGNVLYPCPVRACVDGTGVRVTFCNWCVDPDRPSPTNHPGGQAEHVSARTEDAP